MSRQYTINRRVGWRYVGSEIAVFNCENQQIAIWNEASSLLWEKINGGVRSDELVEFLVSEYSIGEKRARKDVVAFLQEASSCGFINHAGSGSKKAEKTENKSGEEGENVLLAIEMKAIEKLIPFAVTFETTYVCNETCIHCYMDRNRPSISLNEIRRVLDEIVIAGCLFVSFTGGEFFARSDALKIVEYASGLHFVIDILSNGTLITEDKANMLSRHPIRRVQISLYGATSKTHDSITRLSGSFEKTLCGIDFLTKAGVKVEIAFPLMGINFHERHMVKNLADSLGCLISPSHIVTARNDGRQDTFHLRLNDEQIKLFLEDKELSALYSGRKPFQDHQFYFKFSDLADATPCYSGVNSCAITPSGRVLPCNQLLYEVGDLKKDGFSEIWHNSPQLQYLRGLTIGKLTKCSKCQLLDSCARCPGLALLEGGDLLGPSPENCRIATINHALEGGENT